MVNRVYVHIEKPFRIIIFYIMCVSLFLIDREIKIPLILCQSLQTNKRATALTYYYVDKGYNRQ